MVLIVLHMQFFPGKSGKRKASYELMYGCFFKLCFRSMFKVVYRKFDLQKAAQ